MTSSLTQPSTLSFNSTRYLPLDITQSIYGLYHPQPQAGMPPLPYPGFTPFPSTLFCKELQEAHEANLKLINQSAGAANLHHPLSVNVPNDTPLEPLNLSQSAAVNSTTQSVITKTPTVAQNGSIAENPRPPPGLIKPTAVRVIRQDQSSSIVTSSTSDTDSTASGPTSVAESIDSGNGSGGCEKPSQTSTQSKVIVTPERKKKEIVKDDAYWERRRKNNDAAKRSRDSRRRKEEDVAMRAALLEQENMRLRFEVERLRSEVERHRILALKSSPFNATANLAAALAAANAHATTMPLTASTLASVHGGGSNMPLSNSMSLAGVNDPLLRPV